jgi:hypothetical protein
MNMREPQQTLQADEEATLVVSGEEATLVSPRFDDEETLVARPVVPLDTEGAVPPVETRAASPLAPRPYAARRSWVLALVLVSVLIGGVLGGAGLYIYQRQAQDDGTAAMNPQPTPAPETQQPAPAPTAEAAAAPQPEAPAADTEADAGEDAEPPVVEADNDASDAREPESAPAAERRDDAGSNAGPRKRGKKGEHDAEVERPERVRPRTDGPVAREDSDPREARRVDTIFYRPRRAERRAARRARRDADRLRRIFEGSPE